MIDTILDYICPQKCIYCNKTGEIICEKCLEQIYDTHIFKKVNNNVFDYVFCGSNYNNIIRTQIHSFKFHEKAYLYKYFIRICLRNKQIIDFLKQFDYITYVPMHYKKERKRGYNQSKLLAKELGIKLNIKVKKYLKKVKENKVQSLLNQKERIENVKNVYKIKKSRYLNNKKIILVDDIFTTGSTIKECSKILKENGANIICVFVVAKA